MEMDHNPRSISSVLSIDVLNSFKVIGAPDSIYHIPDYITEAEEADLIRRVDSSPLPKWTTLSNRRLQNWGGLPHPKGMISEPLPDWLSPYCDRISDMGIFREFQGETRRANHVLVNEYLSGQGILPHEDGPLYHPTVTTISLGSHTLLDFYRKLSAIDLSDDETDSTLQQRFLGSVLVQPRSLVIVRDEAYTNCLHGIKEVTKDTVSESIFNRKQINLLGSTEDSGATPAEIAEVLERGRRISLTIRHFPKVVKSKIFLRRK